MIAHTIDMAGALAHRITRLVPVRLANEEMGERVAIVLAKHHEPVSQDELLKRHDRARNKAEHRIQTAVNSWVDQARENAEAKRKKDESELIQMFLLLMLDAEADAYFDNSPMLDQDADSRPLKRFTNLERLKEAEDWAQSRQKLLKNFPAETLARINEAGGELAAVAREIKRGQGRVVAETEAQAFYGAAELRVLQRAGYKTVKWITMNDDRVRESHIRCEAEGAIPIGRRFSNGCRYPGDPEADISETINCRCFIAPGSK